MGKLIEGELTPLLRGWMNYFRLAEVKGTFEELDGWIRRKLRGLIWRQWKRPLTRLKGLIQRDLDKVQARKSASNGRGPWWNAGAAHMHAAFPNPTLIVVVFCRCWSNGYASSLLHEPPYTEPFVRWCGRTAEVTPPPTRSRSEKVAQKFMKLDSPFEITDTLLCEGVCHSRG
ncbi:MAG: group II intron maturase-specific domain-containing protein [Pyrinomonadaceae bacterium]